MDIRKQAINIIKAYGGLDNIVNVDYCSTKLRIQVKNSKLVDEKMLIKNSALGVIKSSPQAIFSVFGLESENIANEILKIIKEVSKNPKLKDKYF